MILLDTNVLSEVMKPQASAVVLRWLAAQDPLTIFTTAITQAEVLSGVALLPRGKRREQLAIAVGNMFTNEFSGRILPFDEAAAPAFAEIVAVRGAAGRPISQFDAMIAAIAHSRGAAIATRNTEDFVNCGTPIINPWMP